MPRSDIDILLIMYNWKKKITGLQDVIVSVAMTQSLLENKILFYLTKGKKLPSCGFCHPISENKRKRKPGQIPGPCQNAKNKKDNGDTQHNWSTWNCPQ